MKKLSEWERWRLEHPFRDDPEIVVRTLRSAISGYIKHFEQWTDEDIGDHFAEFQADIQHWRDQLALLDGWAFGDEVKP